MKRPSSGFIDQRKNFSRQGKFLSNKGSPSRVNLSIQTKTTPKKVQFQSIFDSFSSRLLKDQTKIDRKYLKSLLFAQKDRINSRIQIKSSSRVQNSLSSPKSRNLNNSTRLGQKRYESCKKQKVLTESKSRVEIFIDENELDSKEHKEHVNQDKISHQNQKRLLESTNFTIRSFSCLKKSRNCKIEESSSQILKKSLQSKKQQLRSSYQELSGEIPVRQNRLVCSNDNKLGTDQEIQIKLSLKSMSKSEQGQNQIQDPISQMKKSTQNKKLSTLYEQLKNMKFTQQKRPICSSRNFKSSRILLKFDKRILLNASQVNNECLIIQKINKLTSRVKTQSQI